MQYYYERYLNVGQIQPNSDIFIPDDRQFRQFKNTGGNYPLANYAENRQISNPLVVNIYAAITNYFMDKVWDVLPEGQVNSNLIQEFKKATFFRSLYGLGVVARIGDKWQAIDSRFYFPILDRGEKIGSALVVPYATPQDGQLNKSNNTNAHLPNRAWTIQLLDNADTALIQDYEYNGITLGRRLQTGAQEQMRVAVFGSGVKDYDLVEPTITEFNNLMTATSDIIHRFSKPHLQAPASAIRKDSSGNPVLELDSDGSVLPVNRDDKDWKYLTLTTDVSMFEFQATHLLGVISAVSSVPLASFNIHGLPRLESGEGVEALENPANSKVKDWRLEITQAAEAIGISMTWNEQNEQDNQNDE